MACGLEFGFSSAAAQISSATRLLTREKSRCSATRELTGGGLLHHLDQGPELDAVRVGFDLPRFGREGVGAPREMQAPRAARERVDKSRSAGWRWRSAVCSRRSNAALSCRCRRARSRPACRAAAPTPRRCRSAPAGCSSSCRSGFRSSGPACPAPVREVTTIDLPVVSRPYIPAAEMPIPCCPRACFSVWNFDP